MAKHSSTEPRSLWSNISFALAFFAVAGLYVIMMVGAVEKAADVSNDWNETVSAAISPEWEQPG